MKRNRGNSVYLVIVSLSALTFAQLASGDHPKPIYESPSKQKATGSYESVQGQLESSAENDGKCVYFLKTTERDTSSEYGRYFGTSVDTDVLMSYQKVDGLSFTETAPKKFTVRVLEDGFLVGDVYARADIGGYALNAEGDGLAYKTLTDAAKALALKEGVTLPNDDIDSEDPEPVNEVTEDKFMDI